MDWTETPTIMSPTIRVPPKRYVAPVLRAISRYHSETASWVAWVSDPVNMARDPKAAIVRFASGIEQAAATMEHLVACAGYPDVPEGERVARRVLAIVGTLRQAYRVACQLAGHLDTTNLSALRAGAERIETIIGVAGETAAEAAEQLDVEYPMTLLNAVGAALLANGRIADTP